MSEIARQINQELINDNTTLKKEVDSLYKRNYALMSTVKSLIESNERSALQFQKLKRVVDNQHVKIHDLESIIDSLNDELTAYKSKSKTNDYIDQLKSENTQLSTTVQSLQQQIIMLEVKARRYDELTSNI